MQVQLQVQVQRQEQIQSAYFAGAGRFSRVHSALHGTLQRAALHTAFCPQYCTLLAACCTLHTAYCTLHAARCTLHYSLYCALKPAPHTALSAAHCTQHCTLHTALNAAHCTLHTARYTLQTEHCTLHTTHYTLHTAHCTQCCKLHTVLSELQRTLQAAPWLQPGARCSALHFQCSDLQGGAVCSMHRRLQYAVQRAVGSVQLAACSVQRRVQRPAGPNFISLKAGSYGAVRAMRCTREDVARCTPEWQGALLEQLF